MSEKLPTHDLGTPLTPEIFETLRRLFYELPSNAVHYCEIVTGEGDSRRIERHPTSEELFALKGPHFIGTIDPADPETYSGLFILNGTLAAIIQDSTDEGLERIREKAALNALSRISIG